MITTIVTYENAAAVGSCAINSDEFHKLQRRAKYVARSWGYSQHAEDFAQEVCLLYSQGRKATFDQMFIDFLRHEYGHKRSLGGRLRSRAQHTMAAFDGPISGETGQHLSDIIASPGGDPRPVGSTWRDRIVLAERDALICDLRFDEEWTELEIAEYFGVTASRISQVLRIIEKKIASAAMLSECLDTYTDDKEASLLEIKWITL